VALLLHDRELVLHTQERSKDVRIEGSGEFAGRPLDEGSNSTFGSRAVHCYIESSEAIHRRPYEGCDVGFAAYVSAHKATMPRIRRRC
jgi:hypothetical protein